MTTAAFLAAAAFLAISPPPATTATTPSIPPGEVKARHQICYVLATSNPYPAFDIADCLSFATVPAAAFNAQVCAFLREADQLADYDFNSYADCVRIGVVR